jgi:hypothetical protein
MMDYYRNEDGYDTYSHTIDSRNELGALKKRRGNAVCYHPTTRNPCLRICSATSTCDSGSISTFTELSSIVWNQTYVRPMTRINGIQIYAHVSKLRQG